jgi:Uma2 family endonuclease
VTQFDHLFKNARSHALTVHLGNPETTLVEADRWIIVEPGAFRELARYPDLLVAFDADPDICKANNRYIVSEQGKAPDFVLEVAPPSTAAMDTGPKRADYAAIGVLEYCLFDETGEHHGTRLVGYRLEIGAYVPLPIDELAEGVLQGYSRVLNLYLRWERGELGWHDPATGRHIVTFDDRRARADAAEAELAAERARVRELEEMLRQPSP